jgi:(R,R)-butanediol dehydrogenase/meso-butanediol dehydrogenase/diacetyl reductase
VRRQQDDRAAGRGHHPQRGPGRHRGHLFEEPSEFNFFSLSGTDKRVIGTLAYTLDDFIGVSALLANGALKAEPLITGRIGLEDIVEKGFLELINNKDENIKILVKLGE